MTKETKNQEAQVEEMPKTRQFVRDLVQAVKFTIAAAIIITSLIGTYVLANGQLRNQTIDFAQGQTQVEAEAPKAN